MKINSGNFLIDSDDAAHSDGTITVNNGILTISTGDGSIHADKSITIMEKSTSSSLSRALRLQL